MSRLPRPLFFAVAAALLLLDQGTKAWATAALRPLGSVTVVPGLFDLTYLRNAGIAFGLFAGQGWLVALFVTGIILLALYTVRDLDWRRIEPNLVGGVLVGGATGNLLDRARFGSVVDFFDVHLGNAHWPVFNVADSAICCAVGWILWRTLFPVPKATAA